MQNVVIQKSTCKGTLRQVFICIRPPPLLGYCIPPPSPSHSLQYKLYCTLTQKREGVIQREG
jgi:hypothetical protein